MEYENVTQKVLFGHAGHSSLMSWLINTFIFHKQFCFVVSGLKIIGHGNHDNNLELSCITHYVKRVDTVPILFFVNINSAISRQIDTYFVTCSSLSIPFFGVKGREKKETNFRPKTPVVVFPFEEMITFCCRIPPSPNLLSSTTQLSLLCVTLYRSVCRRGKALLARESLS
jgi:hypothetical protein